MKNILLNTLLLFFAGLVLFGCKKDEEIKNSTFTGRCKLIKKTDRWGDSYNYKYDFSGRISEVVINDGGDGISFRYIYNSAGQRSKVEVITDDTVWAYVNYEYNTSGRLTSAIIYMSSGEPGDELIFAGKYVFEYLNSLEGTLSSFDEDNRLASKILFKYDMKGNVIYRELLQGDEYEFRDGKIITYEYDNRENFEKNLADETDETLFLFKRFNTNNITKVTYHIPGSPMELTYVYSYNSTNNRPEQLKIVDKSGQAIDTYNYIFDCR